MMSRKRILGLILAGLVAAGQCSSLMYAENTELLDAGSLLEEEGIPEEADLTDGQTEAEELPAENVGGTDLAEVDDGGAGEDAGAEGSLQPEPVPAPENEAGSAPEYEAGPAPEELLTGETLPEELSGDAGADILAADMVGASEISKIELLNGPDKVFLKPGGGFMYSDNAINVRITLADGTQKIFDQGNIWSEEYPLIDTVVRTDHDHAALKVYLNDNGNEVLTSNLYPVEIVRDDGTLDLLTDGKQVTYTINKGQNTFFLKEKASAGGKYTAVLNVSGASSDITGMQLSADGSYYIIHNADITEKMIKMSVYLPAGAESILGVEVISGSDTPGTVTIDFERKSDENVREQELALNEPSAYDADEWDDYLYHFTAPSDGYYRLSLTADQADEQYGDVYVNCDIYSGSDGYQTQFFPTAEQIGHSTSFYLKKGEEALIELMYIAARKGTIKVEQGETPIVSEVEIAWNTRLPDETTTKSISELLQDVIVECTGNDAYTDTWIRTFIPLEGQKTATDKAGNKVEMVFMSSETDEPVEGDILAPGYYTCLLMYNGKEMNQYSFNVYLTEEELYAMGRKVENGREFTAAAGEKVLVEYAPVKGTETVLLHDMDYGEDFDYDTQKLTLFYKNAEGNIVFDQDLPSCYRGKLFYYMEEYVGKVYILLENTDTESRNSTITLKARKDIKSLSLENKVLYTDSSFDEVHNWKAVVNYADGNTETVSGWNFMYVGATEAGKSIEILAAMNSQGDTLVIYTIDSDGNPSSVPFKMAGTKLDPASYVLGKTTVYVADMDMTVKDNPYSAVLEIKERTVTPTPTPVPESKQFKDVKDPSLFYYEPVYWAVENNITTGWKDNTFRPLDPCTRSAVVTFIWRMAGKPAPTKMASFKDMTTNDDFNKAISWAAENDITTGWKDNTFRPWEPCNRASIVTFLWRYAGKPSAGGMASFKDMTENKDFNQAISWAAEKGITTGWSDNTFRPWNTCNRLSVVSFLYRYAGL